MQLSPLQSRLAASVAASLLVLVLYILLFAPNLALATELSQQLDALVDMSLDREVSLQPSYEPEFALFDRGIVGRQDTSSFSLDNNVAIESNLNAAEWQCYVFEKSTIFDDDTTNSARDVSIGDDDADADIENQPIRRQDDPSKTVYISANTCLQPYALSADKAGTEPPQVTLYMSFASQTGCPDPTTRDYPKDQVVSFEQGAVFYSVNATSSVYITVAAPKVSTDFGGIYNFELAASVDDYYYSYDSEDVELLWMDSDSNSALLVSKNLTDDKTQTDRIMDEKLPYSLYVENEKWPLAAGLQHSACGLGNLAQIAANRNGNSQDNHMVETRMTTRGPGNLPKQQFFLDSLNSSSNYFGVLVKESNTSSTSKRAQGVVGGGGTVFKPTTFQTRSSGNCQLVHDMDFCTDTQYTTPGDESRFSTDELTKLYDDYAKKMYSNFEKVMAQIPCEAGATSRYSLAKNCDDCKTAYKQWLCLVTIPRCEDYDYDDRWAVIRNIGGTFPNGTRLPEEERAPLEKIRAHNMSRNAWIDDKIQPGPYKEILPCEDICYEVVQSCPAAIGFTCPQPHMSAFDVSYGRRRDNSTTSCNFPGEARTPTSMGSEVMPRMLILGAFCMVTVGLLLS